MRVLVTGSRSWADVGTILRALVAIDRRHFDAEDLTLVTGACPQGADRIAEEIAIELCWDLERHPADWKRNGKSAGFKRNAAMVESGADTCLAFLRAPTGAASASSRTPHTAPPTPSRSPNGLVSTSAATTAQPSTPRLRPRRPVISRELENFRPRGAAHRQAAAGSEGVVV